MVNIIRDISLALAFSLFIVAIYWPATAKQTECMSIYIVRDISLALAFSLFIVETKWMHVASLKCFSNFEQNSLTCKLQDKRLC